MFAQLRLDEPSFTRLPTPPALPHYLLENPWPVGGSLILLALIAFFILSHRGVRKPAPFLLTAMGAACGAAVMLLATLVTTDRERTIRATRSLIAALAEARPTPAQVLLEDGVVLSVPGGLRDQPSKADIIALIESAAARAGTYDAQGTTVTIDSYRIRSVLARVSGQTATTQVNVVATARESTVPTGSWWEISWHRDPSKSDLWRATRIELLWLAGFPGIGRR